MSRDEETAQHQYLTAVIAKYNNIPVQVNHGFAMALQNPFFIRPLEPHEWPTYRDIRLRALNESPDAFGGTLASEQMRTPEAWAARVAAAATSGQDFPLIAELSGAAVGLAWAKVDPIDASVVNIFQMWVAPESRGHGVATALLQAAIGWARARNARAVQLGVICGNTPAARLYAREGFRDFGAAEPRHTGARMLEQRMRLSLQSAR